MTYYEELRKRRATQSDAEFWDEILNNAAWLFYGDLDEHFAAFVRHVFAGMEPSPHVGFSFSPWGFRRDNPMVADFAVAYWLFLSELVRLDLAEYGTSPRGAWLTADGQRFKRIFDTISECSDFDWRFDPSSVDENWPNTSRSPEHPPQ